MKLERAGTFKARPIAWSVYEAKSGAVAINLTFEIAAQWNGGEWESWAEYASNEVFGAYYVVKRDGAVNEIAVEQLAKSLRWNGDLRAVTGQPPDIEVQVTVTEEMFDGLTAYKAGWLNPGDHVPNSGASPEKVVALQGRFGSLLRAAAAAASAVTASLNDAKKPPVGTDGLPF